ncbi:AAA family ATPase [Agrobacterium sp. a22-2]|uniref:AAA family ATPase n=1 Tax=Agrobacterium sp. a22-2 TaxID=2283840 RepID=UPI0014483230|nr:AAA family ATPase [Agrobacterium sp. a22-2]NKN37749.1 AAA family ATPase [Agrobacterium sp. a22-2]
MARLISITDAAEHLRSSNRILVIGCSGSGKSTLSQALAGRLELPYVSMDREVFWLPGWQQRPREEMVQRISEIVARLRWIMDGTNPSTLPLRLPRTDLVIWMRPPRWVSLYGVFSRAIRYRGLSRPEMAEGCPERVSLEFLRYVWNFENSAAPRIEAQLAAFPVEIPVLVLKSHAESRRLLAILDRGH